jgi:hypothetical protein
MLIKIAQSRFASRAGATLVEMAATLFIAGIAMSGMVVAYTDGLQHWRKSSEKMVLYSEGATVLSLIERFVRQSDYITTYSAYRVPSHKMDLKVLVYDGNQIVERDAQFYYSSFDNTLRWNNMTGDDGAFNEKLLPQYTFRLERDEKPYLEVQNVTFTPLDTIASTSPSTDGCVLVKIDLLLNDARGDTLALSSMIARRNKAE